MTDQTTDDSGQKNAMTENWYDGLAGDDDGRRETLSQFDTFDDFMADYSAKSDYDWRGAIAGDDDKFKSTLERYADPVAFGNAHREAVQKIRAGDIGPKMPGEDATEDEIKQYRTQLGVPLEADGYLKELPEGLVIGEEDKELVASFIERMHGKHVTPDVVHEGLQWYDEMQGQMQEQQEALDAEQAKAAVDELRDPETGWGKDYRTNMSLVNSLLESTFGAEAKEQLLNGRYGDGKGFFNDVNVLKGLAELARKLNPVGVIIPNEGEPTKALHDEIAEIESLMSNRSSEYYKGPKADAMQARYRELIEARERLKEKSAA